MRPDIKLFFSVLFKPTCGFTFFVRRVLYHALYHELDTFYKRSAFKKGVRTA